MIPETILFLNFIVFLYNTNVTVVTTRCYMFVYLSVQFHLFTLYHSHLINKPFSDTNRCQTAHLDMFCHCFDALQKIRGNKLLGLGLRRSKVKVPQIL